MIVAKKIIWMVVLVFMTGLLMVGCTTPEPTPVPTESPAEPDPTEEPASEPTEEPTEVPTEDVEVAEVVEVVDPATYDALYNFEDGTTQGWEPRGETAVSISTDRANSGTQSILVTDRQETWHGAALNVTDLMEPDTEYNISVYARVADGEPESQFMLRLLRTPAGETAVNEWIASSPMFGTEEPDWVRLGGKYSYSGETGELILFVESPSEELVDFYLDDINIAEYVDPNKAVLMPPQTDIPSLHETFADKFLVGAAIEPYQLNSDFHADLLTRHFNIVTPENVMKPISIQPREGEFTWNEADKLVEFARENGMAVHGHALVWHQQVPDWMFEDAKGKLLEPSPESKELVLQRLETHIRAITERYEDDIVLWDVVNEVIDATEDDCMRRSKWYELTGKEYIATAFRVADEMLPDTALIINDYATTDPAKRTCLINLVEELQADGVRVDGIGMQMHVNVQSPPGAAVEQTIELFAELGDVHITELDMSLYTNDTDTYTEVPEDVLVLQGYRHKELFEVFARQAENIETVTFWGMADDHTWLKTWPITRINLPLPFDESLQAKYAYWGMIDPNQMPVLNVKADIGKGTPAIDGVLDDLWGAQSWMPLQAGEDLTIGYQTRWDENNLYLFLMGEGPGYELETVDVFIDANKGQTETYEGDDLHITVQGGACVDCEGVEVAGAGDDSHHMLEMAILLGVTADVGDEIGFDVRVTRASMAEPISWNDHTNSQDSDTSKFGVLKFVEAARVITAVNGTPVIDGEKDEIWAGAEEMETAVWVLGDSGATAAAKTMWDDEYLYAYVTVTDALLSKKASNPWEQDSIEIYVDQNNAKTTVYQPDDGQYRVNFDNEQSFLGGAAAEKITSASRLTDDGYVIELAIQLDAIQPQEGMIVGFDFQVNNDENGNGVRDTVATWNDPTHLSYQNTSRLGLLMFGQ